MLVCSHNNLWGFINYPPCIWCVKSWLFRAAQHFPGVAEALAPAFTFAGHPCLS